MPAGGTECSIHTCQQINVFCLWQCLMAFSRVKAEKKRNDLFLLNKIETLRRQFHFRQTLSFSDYRSTAQPINSLSAHSGKMEDTGYLAGLWAVVGDGWARCWDLSAGRFAFLVKGRVLVCFSPVPACLFHSLNAQILGTKRRVFSINQ